LPWSTSLGAPHFPFQETFMSLALHIPNALKDNINIPILSEIVQQLFDDGH
jgi:hypothetical protein